MHFKAFFQLNDEQGGANKPKYANTHTHSHPEEKNEFYRASPTRTQRAFAWPCGFLFVCVMNVNVNVQGKCLIAPRCWCDKVSDSWTIYKSRLWIRQFNLNWIKLRRNNWNELIECLSTCAVFNIPTSKVPPHSKWDSNGFAMLVCLSACRCACVQHAFSARFA